MGIFSQQKKQENSKEKTYDYNIKPFIATLYKVILSLDLCNQLFYIIVLMNLGHT